MDNLLVRPLAPPPQTHTSDRPIFKNSFDSENSGKLMRYYVAISLIFASKDVIKIFGPPEIRPGRRICYSA